MWVCNKHVKDGLKLLGTPHIRKAETDATCAFCKDVAVMNMYFTHKPTPRKKKSCGSCAKCSCLIAN